MKRFQINSYWVCTGSSCRLQGLKVTVLQNAPLLRGFIFAVKWEIQAVSITDKRGVSDVTNQRTHKEPRKLRPVHFQFVNYIHTSSFPPMRHTSLGQHKNGNLADIAGPLTRLQPSVHQPGDFPRTGTNNKITSSLLTLENTW